MSLHNSIRQSLVYLLLLLAVVLTACGSGKPRSLTEELDEIIKVKGRYEMLRETRIDKLREMLRIPNLTPDQEVGINNRLYEEFRKYKLDSAIRYVERNHAIAQSQHNLELEQKTDLQLAKLYSLTGRSVEAAQILESIHASQLSKELLPVYYDANNRFLKHYATISGQRSQRNLMNAYRDSIILTSAAGSYEHEIQVCYQLLANGNTSEAKLRIERLFENPDADSVRYAETAYLMGDYYQAVGDNKAAKRCYTLSAIADVKNAVKENASFHKLAQMYYDEGELTRAFEYTQAAIEDALFSNVQFRAAQMSKFYSIINSIHQTQESASKSKLQQYLILISALTLVLILLFILVYKQIHKLYGIKRQLSHTNGQLMHLNDELQEKNSQLSDSNAIKEQYIARFFDLCSMYIDKMEEYRKSLNKLAQNRKMDELFKQLKSTTMMENELDELYKNFDAVFLNLYPTFVADFNALLVEDERVVLKQEDLLNKELRIYALLRLGITDNIKIASFLRCSLSTVYNYRTKARNKAAISREDFEKMVMRIGVALREEV